MSRLGLTREERAWVGQVLAATQWRRQWLWFHVAALLPGTGFGAFGIVRGDAIALGIGFCGVLLFVAWRLWREWKVAPLIQSLCRKVEAAERGEPCAS